jgi:hypothetical protein
MERITISDHITYTLFYTKERAFVGRESDLDHDSTESEVLCCDGGATSFLLSSFMNCGIFSDIKECVVSIQAPQGRTVMYSSIVY